MSSWEKSLYWTINADTHLQTKEHLLLVGMQQASSNASPRPQQTGNMG